MSQYDQLLSYIEDSWIKNTVFPNRSKRFTNVRNFLLRIGEIQLPNPFVSPNNRYFYGTQYYWDTYYTILGLVDSGRVKMAQGMVDNLIYLFKMFGYVPARNTIFSKGRSQPPLLTSMAWEVFNKTKDKKWMDEVMRVAELEYTNFWTKNHKIDAETKLSLYRPQKLKKLLTVYESGWDVSSRFAFGNQNVIPVDLNCMLYKYETDLYEWAKYKKDVKSQKKWQKLYKDRATRINKFFWDEKSGFYYDFMINEIQFGTFRSLAGYYPMWCGVASNAQAKAMVKNLKYFEHKGGLSNTEPVKWLRRQWDYPNGWAPQQHVTILGLIRYGHEKEAKRLIKKWLDCVERNFKSTNTTWEKYDVTTLKKGKRGRYPTQASFAWTNAVFLRLHNLLRQIESK